MRMKKEAAKSMVCKQCGKETPVEVPVCPQCGAPAFHTQKSAPVRLHAPETDGNYDVAGEAEDYPEPYRVPQPEQKPPKKPENEIRGFRRFLVSFLCVLAVLLMLGSVGALFYMNAKGIGSASASTPSEAVTTEPHPTATEPKMKFKLPDTIGLKSDDALKMLIKAGLSPTVQTTATADTPEGFVISQSPKAGTTVQTGDKVTINVAAK